MKYRVRPGLVSVNICGCFFLVPTRSASETFSRVVPLSFLQLPVWEGICKGYSREILLLPLRILLKNKSEDEINAYLDDQIEYLYQEGVLILADDDAAGSPLSS